MSVLFTELLFLLWTMSKTILFYFLIEFDVQCSDSAFAVYFNKTALELRDTAQNNRTYSIKFSGSTLPSCMVDGNSEDKINKDYDASVPSSIFSSKITIGILFGQEMCGVNVFSDDTHIIYNTTIIVTYGENPNDMIRREEYDYYNVMCLRNRTVEEKITGDNFNVTYRNDGTDAQSNRLFYIFLFFSSVKFSP